MPEDLAQISMDWGMCRGEAVMELAPTGLSPEEAARQIAARCEPHATRLEAAGVAHFGPAWRAEVENLRRSDRAAAAQEVRDQRAGRSSADPVTAWGECLGRQARTAEGARDREASIDNAFSACAREESAARRVIAARLSPGEVEGQIQLMRRIVRERAFPPGGPAPR